LIHRPTTLLSIGLASIGATLLFKKIQLPEQMELTVKQAFIVLAWADLQVPKQQGSSEAKDSGKAR
jgi:hypothetical protein